MLHRTLRGQLIIRKNIKIIATGCHILRLKFSCPFVRMCLRRSLTHRLHMSKPDIVSDIGLFVFETLCSLQTMSRLERNVITLSRTVTNSASVAA